MKGLHIITIGLIFLVMFGVTKVHQESKDRDTALDQRIADLELALAAKTPKLIKFYTIPGYDCETSEIAGHCTKWNITQAAYDKDFFKEVGQ